MCKAWLMNATQAVNTMKPGEAGHARQSLCTGFSHSSRHTENPANSNCPRLVLMLLCTLPPCVEGYWASRAVRGRENKQTTIRKMRSGPPVGIRRFPVRSSTLTRRTSALFFQLQALKTCFVVTASNLELQVGKKKQTSSGENNIKCFIGSVLQRKARDEDWSSAWACQRWDKTQQTRWSAQTLLHGAAVFPGGGEENLNSSSFEFSIVSLREWQAAVFRCFSTSHFTF